MDDMDHEIGSCGDNAEIDLSAEGDDLSVEELDVNNAKTFVYYPQVADEFRPNLGQEFQTLDDVHTFYNTYAMHAGFSVRKYNERKKVGSDEIVRKEYVCYKQGKGKQIADVDVKRKLLTYIITLDIHYKYHDIDKLPTKYILKRWTKTANSSGVVDDNGVAIKDDKPYLLLRSQLIQQSLDLIDMSLTNEEATNVLKECLGNAGEKIKQIFGKNGSERNNEMKSVAMSVSKSVNMTGTYEHSYIEPNQVRAKGCGKRLKGGKERALGKAKNPKNRRCHGCDKVGVTHDKRNCPALNNRTRSSNVVVTQDSSVDDDSDSPTEWPSEL